MREPRHSSWLRGTLERIAASNTQEIIPPDNDGGNGGGVVVHLQSLDQLAKAIRAVTNQIVTCESEHDRLLAELHRLQGQMAEAMKGLGIRAEVVTR